MNAEVTHLQSAHPWSKNPDASHSDSPAWIPPSFFPAPYSCEKMYPGDSLPSPDPQHAEAQLDFFHKLGYSTAQVQAVQQKFGPGVDTDKVLGELVRIGASREERQGPVTTVSVVVARGDGQAAAPKLLMPFTASPPQSREESAEDEDALRPIVIDGSNVAMSHGNKEVFSCLGIQLTVNFFLDRGHTKITVFVPSWRKEQPRPDVPITDQHILRDLESKKLLVFTPSRYYGGKRVVCNDDNFIVKEAFESDGIMVSNDMYRDLQREKPEWKRFIEERLLMYSFVNNKFMPPDDPLGRHGPNLENFLRKFPKTQKKKPCPYGKKCTYGIKCKFSHPERAKQSNRAVADELRDRDPGKHPSTAQKQPSARSSPVPGLSLSLVKDMAEKLTLVDEVKKEHQKRDRSSKRSTSRKEKTSQRLSPDHGSQEQLDSGLGSIDSVCDKYGPAYGSCQHPHGVRQQYGPPRSAPCSCCSQGPSSWGTAPAFQRYSVGPVSGDMAPYGQPQYATYGGYPVSMPPYSQPPDFQHSRPHGQQQRYWSDPFGAHPSPPHHWDQPQGKQASPRGGGGGSEEREVVRKKLLAIFSSHLVDTAMDMFPQLMDPQKLVAEIVMLQSQNSSLR